jgi:hypothetical protein
MASAADDPYAITRAVVRADTGVDELGAILEGRRPAAPRRPLRRLAWRAVRRAGAEPVVGRLRGSA